jgi:hypothetical protein
MKKSQSKKTGGMKSGSKSGSGLRAMSKDEMQRAAQRVKVARYYTSLGPPYDIKELRHAGV